MTIEYKDLQNGYFETILTPQENITYYIIEPITNGAGVFFMSIDSDGNVRIHAPTFQNKGTKILGHISDPNMCWFDGTDKMRATNGAIVSKVKRTTQIVLPTKEQSEKEKYETQS